MDSVQCVCRKLLHTTEMSASLCSAHASLTYVSEHLLFDVCLNTQVLKDDNFILCQSKIDITGVRLNARLDRERMDQFTPNLACLFLERRKRS
jgi:hypothetical protein